MEDMIVRREVDYCLSAGQIARGIEPDFVGEPSKAVKGAFKKHYQYDHFDEVYVETYANGALLFKAVPGGGHYEWFNKNRVKDCFAKARLLGARSNTLNRMMG